MTAKWNFLAGSYWYVPTQYLPAFQMSATNTEPTRMVDQTVWQITDYKYGYFWGNCAVLMYPSGTEPTAAPSAHRMIGTVMPDGKVQISFMPLIELGGALAITGTGAIQEQEGDMVFAMQMASGATYLTAHWASMYATKEGDPSWNQLPGTDYSVPAFLEAAGF